MLQAFLPVLEQSQAGLRRSASAVLVSLVSHCRKPDTFLPWLLATLLGEAGRIWDRRSVIWDMFVMTAMTTLIPLSVLSDFYSPFPHGLVIPGLVGVVHRASGYVKPPGSCWWPPLGEGGANQSPCATPHSWARLPG